MEESQEFEIKPSEGDLIEWAYEDDDETYSWLNENGLFHARWKDFGSIRSGDRHPEVYLRAFSVNEQKDSQIIGECDQCGQKIDASWQHWQCPGGSGGFGSCDGKIVKLGE